MPETGSKGTCPQYPHAVILVSHDRFFLDAVVTRIADLGLRTITDYPGNYSHYVTERDARLEQLRQAKKDQDEEVARIKLFVDRFRYQATKAAQVQSRIKLLDKVVPIEVPPERKRIHFTFPACAKSGRTVLELKHVRKAYGDLIVFRDLNLHIERGDRIALVGPNGAGKSTLMRMLSRAEAPDSGSRQEGHQVVIEYFAQDEATRLNPSLTVHDTLQDGSPVHMVPMIRNILGGFLFTGDDVYKRAGVLSGRRAHSAGGGAHAATARPTRSCSTSPPITSISTPRTSCSTRLRTMAAPSSSSPTIGISSSGSRRRSLRWGTGRRSCFRARTRSSSGAKNIPSRWPPRGRRGPRRLRPGLEAAATARPPARSAS